MHVQSLARIMASERVMNDLPADVAGPLAEAMLARRSERVPTSRRSLLGGIARCGVCGGSMVVGSSRIKSTGRWYAYNCPTPGHAHISATWLDGLVSERVVEAIDTGKLAEAIKRHRKPKASRKASEIEARLALLDEMFTEGKISKDRYQTSNASLLEQLAEARQTERHRGIRLPADLAKNLGERWDGLSLETRRNIVSAVVEKIVVAKADAWQRPPDPDRIALVWRS
jgi:site-specific DNA recombinase